MKFAFFSELDIPRMVLNDFAAQHIAVNMRIYLRSCNGFMPQHALDCPQVGSTFQQVRGKRVAKGVGTDVFGDARRFCQLLNHVENHDARNVVPPAS